MKIELITSRNNQRLVNARKVRDGRVADKMFIEGRRLVREALRSDITIEECFFSDEFDDDELRKAFHGPVFELPTTLFRSIADTDTPQGIIIIAQRPNTSSITVDLTSAVPLLIYLHEINNPSNLGAVIRTAEAAGVTGVIVSTDSADVFSPKALRAAMGSSFRVAMWQDAGFAEALRWAKKNDLISTAADVSGSLSYTAADWKKPRLLICGSEAHGLTEEQLEKVDESIRIPMENTVESLNVAVSAGVILFEAKRQNER
jgi:RNA methyltransferase, TrmH family